MPWQSRGKDGRAASGYDAAMLPGRAQSAIALPPGIYVLQAQRGETVIALREERVTQDESRWSMPSLPR